MPYNSLADVVRLLAERSDTKSTVKVGGFRSYFQASYVCSHTEELWYNEIVSLWMTMCVYIFICCTHICFPKFSLNDYVKINIFDWNKVYAICYV